MNDEPHPLSAEPSTDDWRLTHIAQTLQEVETVLINTSPPRPTSTTSSPPTATSAAIALLINHVQFARHDLTPNNPPF